MSRARTASAAAVLLAELAARPAIAQEESAIAEQLFRDGRDLLDRGQTAQACEKFAASERLAPAIGTRLNLALCREKQGRTATAWSLYAEVEAQAQRAGDAARAQFAHDHGTALAGQLRKIVIDAASPPAGMVIKLDGTVLPSGVLGTEIPLDPGDHELAVTAPGKKPWVEPRLNLGASTTTAHIAVGLEDEPAEAAPPGPAPESPLATPETASPNASTAPGPDQRRVAGYAAGGAGIVLLGVASYYGLTAISRKDAEQNYPAGSQDWLTVYDQAREAQTLGLAFAGLGAAALGTGIVLVLITLVPQHATAGVSVVPALGARAGGLSLRGKF